MRDPKRDLLERSLAAGLLAFAAVGCGSSTTSTDVAYEDAYAGDYYYPADVAAAGVYGVGWGYGIYVVTPTINGLTQSLIALADGGLRDASITGGAGANGTGAAGANGTAGHNGTAGNGGTAGANGSAGSSGSPATGTTTVRGAVGEAIRAIALGADVCPGQATVTRGGGATSVCGLSGPGLTIAFNGCQLSAGGTIDGMVSVQFNLSASDTNCNASTTISIGYTSTVTNLTYTGTGGAKIVIPTQTDMATLHLPFGQAPGTLTIMSSGEIQRLGTDGTTTSDRTFTGTRMFSSISIGNETYTIDGAINVTDKAGGTATVTGTGVQRERSCCKPTGGTLMVSRTGGSHAGNHSWTYSSTCGSATLDGKTVTLPACL